MTHAVTVSTTQLASFVTEGIIICINDHNVYPKTQNIVPHKKQLQSSCKTPTKMAKNIIYASHLVTLKFNSLNWLWAYGRHFLLQPRLQPEADASLFFIFAWKHKTWWLNAWEKKKKQQPNHNNQSATFSIVFFKTNDPPPKLFDVFCRHSA